MNGEPKQNSDWVTRQEKNKSPEYVGINLEEITRINKKLGKSILDMKIVVNKGLDQQIEFWTTVQKYVLMGFVRVLPGELDRIQKNIKALGSYKAFGKSEGVLDTINDTSNNLHTILDGGYERSVD